MVHLDETGLRVLKDLTIALKAEDKFALFYVQGCLENGVKVDVQRIIILHLIN